ncbi:accessory gene regulator B family protein [Paenibacillus sp. BR2-3]|uniref:accessory gene regulator B family protein n=1 Tax=Paenibacillus sp. BR2-3 TaxID=3048494 RepID=UPI003977A2F9
MIDMVAAKLAMRIKRTVPDHPASEAVLKFALALVINALLIIILSISISLFTGRTQETIIILISFAILRQLSGGLHLKSGIWCVIGSTVIITILSLLHPTHLWIQILNVTGMLLALIYAPSRIERQSRIPSRYYPFLKASSFLLVASNLWIQSPVLALSFFMQCITLIKKRR